MSSQSEKALEHRARRVTRREGFVLRKSRTTGGFMVLDPAMNIPVSDVLSAQGILDFFSTEA